MAGAGTQATACAVRYSGAINRLHQPGPDSEGLTRTVPGMTLGGQKDQLSLMAGAAERLLLGVLKEATLSIQISEFSKGSPE